MTHTRFSSIVLLFLAAILISACGAQASGYPASTPAAPPTAALPIEATPVSLPTVEPAPSTTAVPAGQPLTITPDNNNQTITMTVGDTFLLKLGETMDWTVTVDDQNVVSRVKNIAVIRGAQGVYQASQPGTTTLHAIGDPPCRQNTPPCAAPSMAFTLHIVVQAA